MTLTTLGDLAAAGLAVDDAQARAIGIPMPLPDFGSEHATLGWHLLVRALTESRKVTPPPVTGATATGVWLERLRVKAASSPEVLAVGTTYVTAASCLHAGVAFADLARFGQIVGYRPNRAARLLIDLIRATTVEDPRCPLRDAVGWALQTALLPGPETMETVRAWRAVGLGRTGWRYAAAGLTPREARTRLDAESLDERAVTGLLALRSEPVPV